MLTVAKGVKSFELREQAGSFRAWLKAIARSRAMDHARAGKRRIVEGRLDSVSEIEGPAGDGNDSAIANQELADLYTRATVELSNYFRKESVDIFIALVQGSSVASLAAETGKSEAAIRQTKVRVLARLREIAGE